MKEKSFIFLLPATLCLLVAGIQLILASNTSLSSWKMGGFGMFSTIYTRVLLVTTQEQGKYKLINLKHENFESQRERLTKNYVDEITLFPTDASLRQLKDYLLLSRFLSSSGGYSYVPADMGLFYRDAQTVKIPPQQEVWSYMGKALFSNLQIKVFQMTYDSHKQRIGYELINEQQYDF